MRQQHDSYRYRININRCAIVRLDRTIQENSESIIHMLDPMVKPGNDKNVILEEIAQYVTKETTCS